MNTDESRITDDELRTYLLHQPVEWLVAQLLTAARSTPMLRAKLAAGADTNPTVDVTGILARLDRAADTGGYIHHREAASFAYHFGNEMDAVNDLLAAGFTAAAVTVVEHAIRLLEQATGEVDDSDGELGSVLADAQHLHAQACEQAHVDQKELGERLAQWALGSEWEVFLESPTTHAQALGEVGLDAFESIVDRYFNQLPILAPGDDRNRGSSPSRFTVTSLKTDLAARRGTDAVVEVMSRDLASPYRYLQIANLLAQDGRDAEALEWLEQGQSQNFGGYPDRRLDDLAADLHRRAGRSEVATGLVADRFAESPTVAHFDRLHEFANESGDWSQRREAALKVLRALPKAPALGATQAYPGGDATGHGVLVQVLLAEGDVDGAWQAANTGGCGNAVWVQVAAARGAEHPADAMKVFQLLGARELDGGNRSAYQSGAALIQKAHRFAEAAGLTAQSTSWILALREANRRRPALQNEFDRHQLPRLR